MKKEKFWNLIISFILSAIIAAGFILMLSNNTMASRYEGRTEVNAYIEPIPSETAGASDSTASANEDESMLKDNDKVSVQNTKSVGTGDSYVNKILISGILLMLSFIIIIVFIIRSIIRVGVSGNGSGK